MRFVPLLFTLAPQVALADCVYTGAKRAYLQCIYDEVLTNAAGLVDAGAALLGLDARITAAEDDADALAGQVTSLGADLGALQGDVTAIASSVDALDAGLSTSQADIAGLQGALADALADIGDLQAAVAQLESVVLRDGSVAGPAVSCLRLHEDHPALPSGTYWLDVDGTGAALAFQAYCDMQTDGGGWTALLSPTSVGTDTIPGVAMTQTLLAGTGNCQSAVFTNTAAGFHVATGYGCSSGTYRWNLNWTNPLGARDVRLVAAVQGYSTATLSVNGRALSPNGTDGSAVLNCRYWNRTGANGTPGTNQCFANVLNVNGMAVPGVLGGAEMNIEVVAGPAASPNSSWGAGYNISALYVR